jgi:N-acetylneuraminic acid mutarotase
MGGSAGTIGVMPTTRGALGVPSAQYSPGERQWSATWTGADGSFWLFGGWGEDATGAGGSLNDLWRFTPATNEWTWMSGSASLNTSGAYGTLSSPAAANTPGARYQAVTWVDKSGNLWLFGGWGYDSAGTLGFLNDLWMYNIATNEWTWEGGGNLANQFSAFGASGQSSTSYIPGSRYSAMSWVDASGNFWLFGGAGNYLNNSSETNVVMNDLWKYSPSSGEWTWYGGEVPGSYGTLGYSTASNQPGERTSGATWVDANGTLWLFGGLGVDALSSVGALGDLWSLNPTNQQWTWVSGPNVSNSTGDYGVLGVASASNYSPGRMYTNVWQDKSGNVWIFGGGAVNTANQPILLNDLWEYAPTTNLWTWVAGTPLADVSQFAVNGVYGTLGIPDAANIPGGRVGAANWTDQQGNFWLYGGNWGPFINNGSTDSYLSFDDLWLYNPPASASAPQAVLTPLQLSFSTPTGVTAPAQTVTLSNFGAAALTIGNIAIGGANASAFNEYNTCGTSLAPGASCTITVSFAPSASGFNAATLTVTDNAATTLPIALNGIAQAQTTLALSTSPASTSLVLAPVKLTATLSPSSDSAASTDGEIVIFRDGNQILGGEQMTNGVATMTTTQLPFGTSTLTASYAGNKYFAAATSAGSSFTVTYPTNLTATQTALVFLAGGQPVTSASRTSLVNLTATVTSNGSPVTPGIVTFCDAAYASCVGQGLIGIAQTNSKGVATFPMRFGAGAHQVVARFQVQSTLAASVSPVTAISINNALTTAGLASSGTSAGYELTATIAGFGPKNAPTGSVQFIDTSNNNAVLGTVQLEGATESQSYVVGPEIPDTAGFGWYTTTADLNGDGIPDVIVVNGVADLAGNNVPETIQVYLGKGDGTFNALAPQQIVANSPSGVASLPIFDSASITIGDFNQDGIPDLAIGLSQSPTAGAAIANTIAILLGNGDGTFAVQQTQLQPVDGSAFLAAPVVADFNGDGIPDILATYGIVDFDYSVLYLGNGDGTFQTATATTPISFFETSVPFPTYFPAVSDFNGDGIPDVGFVSQLGAYSEIGLGNGTFSSVLTADTLSPPIDQEPAYVPVVGDFNGDGKPDMAVTSPGSQIPIFLGNGDGTFTTTTQTPAVTNESWNLVTADFAGNGFDGFASANDDTTISVFKSNGDGTFTQQNITVGIGHTGPPGEIPFYPTGIAAGDFHNSGRKDIVFSIEGDYAIQTVENRLTETATVKLENVRVAGSGTHNIVAVYAGDSLFATSTSSSVALGAESLNSTTTSFTVTPTQGLTGAPVTLSATAAPVSGSTTPTGDISFLDGSSVLAVLPVNSSGSASYSSTSFAAGTHSFTAVYSGDANNLTSTSPLITATYTVTPATGGGAGDWTWMGGSSSVGSNGGGQSGVYGTLGTPAAGNIPGGRDEASSWTDHNGNFWLFGGIGIGADGNPGYLNSLWEFNPSTNQWAWMGGSSTRGSFSGQPGVYGTLGTPAAGNIPGSTDSASTWVDNSGNLWLFGGLVYGPGDNSGSLNELWEFNPSTNEWAWMSGSSTVINNGAPSGVYGTLGTPASGNVPGGRSGASSWTDNSGHLWLFGGHGADAQGNSGSLNDLWEFNPSTDEWTWMGGSSTVAEGGVAPGVYGTLGTPAAGNAPGGRYYASSWTDSSGHLWLFGGGATYENVKSVTLNDLWEFNPSTNEWAWMSGSSTVGSNCFLITGDGESFCGQPGVYGTLGTPAPGNTPGGRAAATSWTDSSGNLWLFGGSGFDANGTYVSLNDLWEFNPSTDEWTWMGGSSTVAEGGVAPGVYGTLGTLAAGNIPGGRDSATSWTDSSGNLWLFGGYGFDANGNNGYLNDLWRYQLSATTLAAAATPTFSVPGGTYSSTQSVTISDTTPNATIYYTTDGTTPTANSTVYSGTAITVASTATIEAIATSSGYTQSAVATAAYTINLPAVAAPTFSVAAGTYSTGQTVTISDTTPGATIYYTTNGTAPSTSSTVYNGAITVAATETLEALATASGYSASAVATATYTITQPVAPSFTISSTTTPQTVQPGGAATYSITVTAQNGTFPNPVTLTASGLPAGATATFLPPSITPGSSSASSALTIQTANPAAALTTKDSKWPLTASALSLIGMFFLPGKRRRRWITLTVLLLASLGAFTALTACGGGFGFTSSATSYTITITGSSGSVQQTTTVPLTVE